MNRDERVLTDSETAIEVARAARRHYTLDLMTELEEWAGPDLSESIAIEVARAARRHYTLDLMAELEEWAGPDLSESITAGVVHQWAKAKIAEVADDTKR